MRRSTMIRPILLTLTLLLFGALLTTAQTGDDDRFAPLEGTITFTMRHGDTLDGIAAAFDVSLQCLMETNLVANPTRLQPGDNLLISDDCPPYEGLAPVRFPRSDAPDLPLAQTEFGLPPNTMPAGPGEAVYTIRPGDSFDLIAARTDVAVDCLVERNGYTRSAVIYARDLLVIPADCPPYDGYSTVPTITLERIPLATPEATGAVPEITPVVTEDVLDSTAEATDAVAEITPVVTEWPPMPVIATVVPSPTQERFPLTPANG